MYKCILWGICFFTTALFAQEPLQCQDATIALDQNGEATITSSDVLVNSSGSLLALDTWGNSVSFTLEEFGNTISNEVDASICYEGIGISPSFDRNPVNSTIYYGADILDIGFEFTSLLDNLECNFDDFLTPIITQDFFFVPPQRFTFDSQGSLYYLSLNNAIVETFDLSTNQSIPFFDAFFDLQDTGITYNFDTNSLLLTTAESNLITIQSLDILTQELETLFSFELSNGCNGAAIEYIGNNTLIVSGNNSSCDIYSINLITQEVNQVFNPNFNGIQDFLFIEAEVENATLSTIAFTCDDIGENTVDVTQIIDGNAVSCEITVTIQSTFEFSNCPVYRSLSTDSNTGMGIIPDLTLNLDLISSCSSEFEITQDIPAGTLVESGENIIVTITATDELGQSAQCFITVSTDPVLSIETISLEENITLYPNPTTAIITLTNRNNIALTNAVITDVNGRVLQTIPLGDAAATTQLSLDTLSNGLYFVRINTENASIVKRVIKN